MRGAQTRTALLAALLLLLLISPSGNAQFSDRNGVPSWEVDKKMPRDLFTFVRIEYSSYGRRGRRGGGGWATDWPDAELNLAWRMQQMTSLRIAPEGIYMRLTDPQLFKYPFIYIVEPGGLVFEEEEVPILRKYLLNGGFLMIDDFWGEREYENLAEQMARVFPDREPEEVPLEHPIFHTVFDLKEKPQIPSIAWAFQGREYGITWEREDAKTPHYKAIYDDKKRIMVFICHNTDLGDGWEREGEDEWYFREFSEKKAYPLGINIIFYAMTH
ncbi:MAG: DUF4159 domain-containing protein [Verrucomicrobiota bacterium]|nr:DUF4159 domain-containing protein [Verrucomicrobiota bacterium]